VTGGASGLGRALAERLLTDGHRVLITDVHRERGEETARELQGRGEIHFETADVTSDEDWRHVVEWCTATWQGLDLLVNNAGVAAAGRIDRVSMADWDWILEINLKGVVRGCRAFTPLLKGQGHGRIVNIASLAAIANAPGMAPYNVAKAGVVALSETLRHELAPYGIAVTVVCPGFFQTNLGDTFRSSEADLDHSMRTLMEKGTMTAEEVAAVILDDTERGRFLVLPQSDGRTTWRIKRLLPFLFNRRMAAFGRRLRAKGGTLS